MKIIGYKYDNFIPLYLKSFNNKYDRVIITHVNDMYTKTILEKEGFNNIFEVLYKLKNNMNAKIYSYNVLTNKSTELNNLHEYVNLFFNNKDPEYGLFDSSILHTILNTFSQDERVLIINLSNFHIGFVEQGIDLQNFLITSKNNNLDILHYINAGSVIGTTAFIKFDSFKLYDFLKKLNLSYIEDEKDNSYKIERKARTDDYLMSILENFTLNIKRNNEDKKFLESIMNKEFVNKLFVHKLSSIVQNKFSILIKDTQSTYNFIIGIINSKIKFNMSNYNHLLKIYKTMIYTINKQEINKIINALTNTDLIINAYAMTSLNTILGYDFSPVFSNDPMIVKTLPNLHDKYFDNNKIRAKPSIVMIPIIYNNSNNNSNNIKEDYLIKLLLGYSFGKSGLNFKDKMYFAYQSILIKYINDSLLYDFKGSILPLLTSVGYLKYNFKKNEEIIEFINNKKLRLQYNYNDLVSIMISYVYSNLNFHRNKEFQFVEIIISELFRKVLSRSLENFNSFDILNLSEREIISFLNGGEVFSILWNILSIASLPILLNKFHQYGEKSKLLNQMSEIYETTQLFNIKSDKYKVVNEIIASINYNLVKLKYDKTKNNIKLFNKLYELYGFNEEKGEIFVIKNLLNGIIFKKNKIYKKYFNDTMLIPQESIKLELSEKDRYIRKYYMIKIKI